MRKGLLLSRKGARGIGSGRVLLIIINMKYVYMIYLIVLGKFLQYLFGH